MTLDARSGYHNRHVNINLVNFAPKHFAPVAELTEQVSSPSIMVPCPKSRIVLRL